MPMQEDPEWEGCMRFTRFAVFLAVGFAALVGLPHLARAKNLALLIGVSNYQLKSLPALKAPGNDVRLVWEALRERGFDKDDMVVLADSLAPGTEEPSHL